MESNACPFCGVFVQKGMKMCRMCEQLFAQNSPAAPENKPEYTFQSAFPPTDAAAVRRENVPPGLRQSAAEQVQPGGARDANNKQSDFYSPPPPVVPPPRKPAAAAPRYPSPAISDRSFLDSVRSLSGTAKFFICAVVLLISLAFVLKGLLSMDLSVQRPATDAPAQNLEPQKRWFSSWFRSNPTGEEILAKYESATFAADKDLISPAVWVAGKLQYLPPNFSEQQAFPVLKKTGSLDLYDPAPSGYYYNGYANQTVNPWNLNATFDMSLKSPNKFLMRLILEPKNAAPVTTYNPQGTSVQKAAPQKIFVNVGSEGVTGWSLTKDFRTGKFAESEKQIGSLDGLASQDTDGISMTYLNRMFIKAELKGEETLFNRRHYVVTATNKAGVAETIYFDVETGLATKVVSDKQETYIAAYRVFEGAQIPSTVLIKLQDKTWFLMEVSEYKQDQEFDDAIFKRSSY